MEEKKWWTAWLLIGAVFVLLIYGVEACTPRWTCPIALQYGGKTYYGGWDIVQGQSLGLEINGETVAVPWLDTEHLVQVGVVSETVDTTYMPEQELACNLGPAVKVGTPVYQMIVRGEYMYVIDYEWEKKSGDTTHVYQMRHFFRERD